MFHLAQKCVVVLVISGFLMSGCAQNRSTLGPNKKQFSSEWVNMPILAAEISVDLTSTDEKRYKLKEMAMHGGSVDLYVQLVNTTDQPLWGTILFEPPEPHQGCEISMQMVPSEPTDFRCTQDGIIPDAGYAIDVSIYADEEHTQRVERKQLDIYFSGSEEIDNGNKNFVYMRLPREFEGLIYSEATGLGGITDQYLKQYPFLQLQSGTLVVTKGGLEYKMKDETITISASTFRSIYIPDDIYNYTSRWVSLVYEEEGARKVIRFMGKYFSKANVRQVYLALRAVPQVMRGVTHREFFVNARYD